MMRSLTTLGAAVLVPAILAACAFGVASPSPTLAPSPAESSHASASVVATPQPVLLPGATELLPTDVAAATAWAAAPSMPDGFDPEAALNGAARYLQIARERFGSEQLAVVSYHMGIGNLESVIEAYTGRETGDGATRQVIAEEGLDYPQLFFDSSPQRNQATWNLLSGFGDDSSLYLWRVLASARIMRDWREDPERLDAINELATAKATLEELYHPEDETETFESHDDVEGARDDGELLAVPSDSSLGFKIAPQAGELADQVGAEAVLYRALRPEALAALTYIGAKVQAISGAKRPLVVTSLTRDREYQELLTGVNPEATTEYSLHTTGYSFDIRRDYASDRQAAAFQFVLDRLKAHAMLDYAYEPAAIHITVSDYARALVE